VLPGVEYPDAAQRDLFPSVLHFQGVAGFQTQLFPQWFGNYDPASRIEREASVHFGILLRTDP
jgi:hypothetical protein